MLAPEHENRDNADIAIENLNTLKIALINFIFAIYAEVDVTLSRFRLPLGRGPGFPQ